MATEIADYLLWNPEGLIADGTLGGGGHSEFFLNRSPTIRVVGLDRDPVAIAHAQNRLGQNPRFSCIHTQFSFAEKVLAKESLSGILCDLGISSRQVDDETRGFSFKGENDIDLRMNASAGIDASAWIRKTSEQDIARALKWNADLDRAHSLARQLKEIVAKSSLNSEKVRELVKSIFPHKPRDQGSLCARVLQAIRMELNDELGEIKTIIQSMPQLMQKGGVVAFLTYHSVEDRLVKHAMAEWEKQCLCPVRQPVCQCGGQNAYFEKLTRKPMLPTDAEIARNPRSRSAKLRVWKKCR